MKKVLGLALLGVAFGLLTQSCGSSPSKKKATPPGPNFGGDAGESSDNGGSAGKGGAGKGGATNGGADNGGDDSAAAGSAGDMGTGDGGTSAGGAGPDCPTGFGECDGNLSDLCEQDLSLVTSCGDCNTTCNSKNGTATCVDQKCNLSCSKGFGDCDVDPNNGCEEALASNNKNCGACGRDCAAEGATCMVDKCSAIAMQTALPYGGDSNGNRTWAFSPVGILHLGVYNYDVTRYPLDGSAALSVWTGTSKGAGNNSLLVLGDDVYWSEFGTGGNDYTAGVFKKKITDAFDVPKTPVFVPEWTVQFLRRSGNALYWASGDYQSGDPGGYIYTRSLTAPDTDAGTKIVSDNQGTHTGIYAMDVTSNAIYWVSQFAGTGKQYELRTTPLAGGTPTVVPEVFANTGTPIAAYGVIPTLRAQADTIYFTRTVGDAQDGIYSFKKGDAKPKLLVSTTATTGLLLDDSYLYYTQQNAAGLFKAPLTGGQGVSITPGQVSKLVGQDAKFVYFIQSGCCSSNLFKTLK